MLVDVSLEAAERGKAYSQKLLDKAVARGRSTVEKRDATWPGSPRPTTWPTLAGCDVVIEAVFEDLALKHETFAKVAGIVGPGRAARLQHLVAADHRAGRGVDRPDDFVGLHFFSPVDKMPLVEIVARRADLDEALARGFDLVRRIDKTPIVVNDSRGFFTSRVFGTYVMEGIALLGEGVPAASVEQAALQAGYPVGPLAVTDEVTLTLAAQGPGGGAQGRAAGDTGPPGRGRGGPDGRRVRPDREVVRQGLLRLPGRRPAKQLWPGLAEAFGDRRRRRGSDADMQERLLFAEALESVKCLDEGVLHRTADGNIGSLFGIGFPAWTGGVLQYIETYPGGVAGFVARAQELADRYGSRFTPPRPSSPAPDRGDQGGPWRSATDLLVDLMTRSPPRPPPRRDHEVSCSRSPPQ